MWDKPEQMVTNLKAFQRDIKTALGAEKDMICNLAFLNRCSLRACESSHRCVSERLFKDQVDARTLTYQGKMVFASHVDKMKQSWRRMPIFKTRRI